MITDIEGVKKYKKKGVIVAIQFDGTNEQECGNFLGECYGQLFDGSGKFVADVFKGKLVVSKGDYIVYDENGEWDVMMPQVFKEMYEEVKE